jgi:ubiquinone/menaquinone biosynthesis C-methylase UbiE
MPSSAHFRAQRQQAYGLENLPEGWEEVFNRSRDPVGPDHLYELAGQLGISSGDLVLDAGCRDGKHGKELEDRFGCLAVGADLVVRGGRLGDVVVPIPRVQCDLEALPFRDGGLDAAWCRDVLEDVEHPDEVLGELRRVVKSGGWLLLYVGYATEMLEPIERARLMNAIELGAGAFGREGIERLVAAAGFRVELFQDISPQYIERSIEDGTFDPQPYLDLARLRRGRDEIEGMIGTEWYEQLVAWNHWHVYMLLGKLQTTVWGLRA